MSDHGEAWQSVWKEWKTSRWGESSGCEAWGGARNQKIHGPQWKSWRWCGWQWSDDKNTWVRQKWDDDQDTDGERENMRAGAPTGHRQPPSIGWTARRRS